ncbi:MAG: hypothetical protein ABH851_00555 [Methanobacteriota archaeon]
MQKTESHGPGELPDFVRETSFPPELARDIRAGEFLHPTLRDQEEVLAELGTHKRSYCQHDYMLCYVTGEGKPYCVPLYGFENCASNPMAESLEQRLHDKYGVGGGKIVEALEAAEYGKESFWVPHSNDFRAWGFLKARELAGREAEAGELLPLEGEPLTPEMIVGAEAEGIAETERLLRQAIRVPDAVEIPSKELTPLPNGLRTNPIQEDLALAHMMGKQQTVHYVGQETDLMGHWRAQFGHFRPQLQMRLGAAPPEVQAVEVFETLGGSSDAGLAIKFVLDRDGNMQKRTAGCSALVVKLLSFNEVMLDSGGEFHITREQRQLD